MAVSARNQPLFNLVVKGHGELRFDIAVALETKSGLRHFEQLLRRAGSMDDMAAGAAHIALAMGRALEMSVSVMARQAFFIHLFGRGRGQVENQSSVAVFCVRRGRAVTVLAGHAFAAIDERRLVVRTLDKALYDLFVAGRAEGEVHRVARIRLRRLEAGEMSFAWLSHN